MKSKEAEAYDILEVFSWLFWNTVSPLLSRATLFVLFYTVRWTPWFKGLRRRMLVTEVGFTGNVSYMDRSIAEKEHLKPLNRFERWILSVPIEIAKKSHRDAFRRSCIETLGEDPEDM